MSTYKNRAFYITILLILAQIVGCGKKADVLAKINGTTITTEDFNKRISKLPSRYQELINQNRRRFLDELIVDELLYREALRQNIDREKDVKEVLYEARKKILIAKLLKEKIDDTASIDDKEVEDYYNAHQDEFRTPEILRASHILVKSEKEAQDILLELANGRNFEDLARTKSVDPTSERGGDIGYFTTRQLDPDFEKVCFEMEEGQISDVVKTRFGYHIIKLTERKSPAAEKFEDVKGRIKQNLIATKRKLEFSDLVQRLKDRAKIEINEDSPLFSAEQQDE